MKYCTHCGTQCADEAAFCSKCGKELCDSAASTPEPSDPPEQAPTKPIYKRFLFWAVFVFAVIYFSSTIVFLSYGMSFTDILFDLSYIVVFIITIALFSVIPFLFNLTSHEQRATYKAIFRSLITLLFVPFAIIFLVSSISRNLIFSLEFTKTSKIFAHSLLALFKACKYKFVVDKLVCPKFADTTLRLAPLFNKIVAHVCLKS